MPGETGKRLNRRKHTLLLYSVVKDMEHDNREADLELVDELLASGAHVDVVDPVSHRSPLVSAGACGCTGLVKLLLGRGV